MTKHIREWAALVVAVGTLSCGATVPDNHLSNARQRVVGAACDVFTPCDAGEICDSAQGFCIEAPPEPDPCEQVLCWPWETCMDGMCIDDPDNCMNTGCETGYYCEGTECVPDCLGQGNCGDCNNDFNCEPGYVCNNGTCAEEE
ncbi:MULTISPECIES: hypothetical protein [unclassified Corallococcus]|uniref:hypothetical protein n=1 Tax=unclassified Corallococcus TaxID=2685029 RepID=UPI001CBB2BA7|nr:MULTISPECIES: hypothetical protein [unclassified Corallococcus]MBZ4330215.1 hypothetical protein [Corallococcus sp. AS-1-12]MBZ4373756.1 hypothetical protein [Corallococcus sp. AS-1-6]